MRQRVPTADSDLRIIAGSKQRDPAALVDLYDRYGRIVYLVALRKVQNSHEAEDIVKEVDRLSAAITNLTCEQLRVVELAYYQGSSQTEISERVGKPLGTAKICVRVALQRLRRRFSDASFDSMRRRYLI